MANVERLLKLADVIEEHDENFNMNFWLLQPVRDYVASGCSNLSSIRNMTRVECGTTMCIAGWATYLWPSSETHFTVKSAAEETLDLNSRETSYLFYLSNEEEAAGANNAKDMAAKIRNFVHEGIPSSWDVHDEN